MDEFPRNRSSSCPGKLKFRKNFSMSFPKFVNKGELIEMIERFWILESCKSSPDLNSRKLQVCGKYTNVTSYFEQEYQDLREIFEVEETTLGLLTTFTMSTTTTDWSTMSTGELITSTKESIPTKSTTKKWTSTEPTTTKPTTTEPTTTRAKTSTKPTTTSMSSDNNRPLIRVDISLVTGKICIRRINPKS